MKNEREERGNPYLTANYHFTVEWTLPDTPATSSFWSSARELSDHMNSPTVAKRSRQWLGMLSWIPDPEPPKVYPNDERRCTGWEHHYLTRAEKGEHPYYWSASISNLAKTTLPPGAVGMFWGAPQSPFNNPLSLFLMGHEKGCEANVSWREGCAITKDDVGELWVAFEKVLRRAAIGKECTLDEISA